jgi:hypothetical protein
MAVPDTNTFTLQDVVTEVNPTTDDLTDCFADAVAGSFDAAYEGSKDRLSNFRNYGAVSYTAFGSSTTAQLNDRNACGQATPTTRYHDGAGIYPVVNDVVWNTSVGTGVPSNGYYKNSGGGYYQLTTGVVTVVGGRK